MTTSLFERAARLIRDADGLLITAGAGMGVDSGLPDFRGEGGFWRHYPALGRAGVRFQDIACPQYFRHDVRLAWGFYGHRLRLYRETAPHEGFHILKRWAERKGHGAFVFTSNVDGQFQKAGFDEERIHEVHGSIHHLQCLAGCRGDIWAADCFDPVVDDAACRLTGPVPTCPHCGGLARPNVLMFGDRSWEGHGADAQEAALWQWLAAVSGPVVIEIGAGTDIPTVRMFGEGLGVPLVRINPREPAVPARDDAVGIALGGLAALRAVDEAMS